MRPENLETTVDYYPALLWLMGEVDSGTTNLVMQEFKRRFADIIPVDHYEVYDSGVIKWEKSVRWSRQALFNVGFMGSGGRGIWIITTEGRDWLNRYPDGGGRKLIELIYQTNKSKYRQHKNRVSDPLTEQKPRVASKIDKRTLTWRGKTWPVNRAELINQAKQILLDHVPLDATRFTKWYILIDDQPISPKWLFHLITGADYADFDSPTARRKLSQIGFESIQLDNEMNGKDDLPLKVGSLLARMDKDVRDEVLLQMAELVVEMLPHEYRHFNVKHYAGTNYIQFDYPEFTGSHYEFILSRVGFKFAIHFESNQELNLSRMEWIKPHVNSISEAFGMEVIAERMGQKWASVHSVIPYSELSNWRWVTQFLQGKEELDELLESKSPIGFITITNAILSNHPGLDIAEIEDHVYISTLFARFIVETYEYVYKAIQTFPNTRKRRRSASLTKSDDGKKEIYNKVDEQVEQINQFLAGRLANRPSDEQLCDWVHFSYQVGLYNEGANLFDYIDANELGNDWLYKRAKKYSQVCRLKSQAGKP